MILLIEKGEKMDLKFATVDYMVPKGLGYIQLCFIQLLILLFLYF